MKENMPIISSRKSKQIHSPRINALNSLSWYYVWISISLLLIVQVDSFQYTSTIHTHTNTNTHTNTDKDTNALYVGTFTNRWIQIESSMNTCLRATDVGRSNSSNNKIGYSRARDDPRLDELQRINNEIRKIMSRKDQDINTQQIRQQVDHMIHIVKSKASPKQNNNSREEEKILQETCRQITQRAFSSSSWPHVKLGLAIMERQAHHRGMPQSVCIQALKALNSLLTSRRNVRNTEENRRLQANAAFRILQRMCTGVGIQSSTQTQNRYYNQSPKKQRTIPIDLDERDFSMVLNGFVNIGEMTMAHQVVALQSRTPHAPPLSPVIYSILIKGYGKLGDGDAVDMVLDQSERNGVKPDIIMCNSLMDAYINCDDVSKAHDIFENLTKAKSGKLNRLEVQDQEQGQEQSLTPTIRTYNTMLKGFVKAENMKKALMLSREMEQVQMWDAVTTNTLVGVAVATKQFDIAESILDKYTVRQGPGSAPGNRYRNHRNRHQRWHPNVEAYTELIDGYAKNGRLNKALAMFKAMRSRGVNPNEYTYTCIIGGLAKAQKIDQAKKQLSAMAESDGIRPSVVTYNALLTGMLMSDKIDDNSDGLDYESRRSQEGDDAIYQAFDESNNDALKLFGVMINSGVSPNAITVATLVDGLGKNKPSRLDEAKALIDKMDVDGFVSKSNARVSTTLIQACARSSDLEGALTAYRGIEKPDVIAFNSLLNGFCDCGRVKMAIDILNANLKKKKTKTTKKKDVKCITPNVATYTILISSLLGIGTSGSSERSFKLYKEMKDEWKILPDPCLIDS